MAHQIDVKSGRANYASTEREWHGLGQLIQPGEGIEEWQRQAGMEYAIKRAFVRYATGHGQDVGEYRKVEESVVLFRDDTGDALGIVSAKYKVVQPKEVLEFFREWTEKGGLTLESAGVLFGGKRYFATAKLGQGVVLDDDGRDKIVPYVLLSTSADGSLATECRWTTVRTVCNNTLSMALADKGVHKTSHRSIFRPEEAKASVEAAHKQFGTFMDTARLLTRAKLSLPGARDLTLSLLQKEGQDPDLVRESAGFGKILSLFNGGGKGSQIITAQGTEWGWLNAVTDYVDHEVRAQSEENRLASALWGQGDKLKQKAVSILTA